MRASIAVLALLAATPAAAADGPGATPILDLRLRYETVDQDGFAARAQAVTLRGRFGFETREISGFRFLLEAEAVAPLVEDYNDTVNGRTGFPVVADPEALELNRAQVVWTGLPGAEITLGRQRIILGNARFVGNVGFRQNEQTFDAVRIQARPTEAVTITYAWIDRVHRVFGNDSPQGEWNLDAHLLHAETETPVGRLTGYGYLIDNASAPALSSQTWGLRLAGTHPLSEDWRFTYAAEYAVQGDYGGAPAGFDLNYWLAEAGVAAHGFNAALMIEELGGDGVRGFQTPLATLHAFQGWADVFLTTPANGVRDTAIRAGYGRSLSGAVTRADVSLVWRDFSSARGGIDYGREFDAMLRLAFGPRWALEIKAAAFDGASLLFADRTKVWTAIEFRY